MNKLFALLTAIDNYHPESTINIPALQGCHNDIFLWQSFLREHVPKERLNMAPPLIDGDATYENVLNHFGGDFLLKAGKGDTVLFVYSGHGSREGAALEFGAYYPEGLQETLVLHNSRTSTGLDFADKELATLIERITLQGAEVVVVLDCCHSGSGTRNLEEFTLSRPRQTDNRRGRRAFDSYLRGEFLNKREGFYLPSSRHILLAACDRNEKAYELGSKQGLFSSCLMQILEATGGRLAYADLYTQCCIAMSKITNNQHPQFETYGYFNGYNGFLGLSEGSLGAPLRIFFDEQKWVANMGAIHGLPVSSGNVAEFEVLKNGGVLGCVRSKVIGMEQSSLVEPVFSLNPHETYNARLMSLKSPKMIFSLTGVTSQIQETLMAFEVFKPIHCELRVNAVHSKCQMQVGEERIQLFRNADEVCLRTIGGNDWGKMFQDAFEKLEHIARWEKMIELDNQNTTIQKGDVELILKELDAAGKVLREAKDREVIIDVLRLNGDEQKVPFRLEIRNKSMNKTRHCVLFYATEEYGFLPVGFNESIPPQSIAIAMEKNAKGEQYKFELTRKNEGTDIFKLFISNNKARAQNLEQRGFNIGDSVWYEKNRKVRESSIPLPRLKAISGWGDNEEEEDTNDWYTITMIVKSVAREASVGERPISLAENYIRIRPHATFRANLGMTSANASTRSIEPLSVISELAKDTGVELITFGEATRDVTHLNTLELTEIENEESLADQPLQFEIAANLQFSEEEEEHLLPITFDGDHLIPVGMAERMENGDALVNITHVPEFFENRRRSLGKALKLCFLKLVLKKKKVQYLRWVDYSGLKGIRQSDGLKTKVAQAENILLLIHGIIGDTKGMIDAVRPLVKLRERDKKPLFDLVLTFDYENLNTTIQTTAGILEDLLCNEAGITPDCDKQITILSHSMGGLVSRYFIENLGGKEIVKHLVMAGTPNGGSAIAKITTYRDYAIPLLALLVNLPWGIPAAAVVLGILAKSRDLTPTLAQMDHEEGDFLKNLNKGSISGVRYSIIAGYLDQYLSNNADGRKLMDKVLKLGGRLFYGHNPNDVAVSVESIKSISKIHSPTPKVIEVASHHLCYFEDSASMGEIVKLLIETPRISTQL